MAGVFFWIFAAIATGGGIFAITRRSPLHCALSLVVSFVALAGLYFQLKAPFPGILQVALYAGAIMVLVIFVIMFLNVPEDLREQDEISKPGVVAALFLGVPLAILLLGVIWGADLPAAASVSPEFGGVAAVGKELFARWVWPFEILSLLILVAMTGAVLIARKRLD